MDQIATAIVLFCIGIGALGIAWLARHAGFKALVILLAAAALGIGGGAWMILP